MKRVGKRAVLTVRKSLTETPRGVNLASQILLDVDWADATEILIN